MQRQGFGSKVVFKSKVLLTGRIHWLYSSQCGSPDSGEWDNLALTELTELTAIPTDIFTVFMYYSCKITSEPD
jgi:hypothetical protein